MEINLAEIKPDSKYNRLSHGIWQFSGGELIHTKPHRRLAVTCKYFKIL